MIIALSIWMVSLNALVKKEWFNSSVNCLAMYPYKDIMEQIRLERKRRGLTQAALANLFQTSIANISMHIRNIYRDGELSEETTIKFDLKVQKEGTRTVKRTVKLYNLNQTPPSESGFTGIEYHLASEPDLYLEKRGKMIPVPSETLKNLAKEGLIYLREYVGRQSVIVKFCGAGLAILDLAVNQVDYRWSNNG